MQFFRNWNIGPRLLAGFGIVILVGLISAIVNSHSISTVKGMANQVKERNFPYALLAEEMAFDTEAVQQFLTDVGATRDPEAYKEAEEAAQRFRGGVEKFREAFKAKNDAKSLKMLDEIDSDFTLFYEQGKKMAQAYIDEGTEGGNRIMRDFDKNSESLSGKVREFKKLQKEEADRLLLGLVASADRTGKFLWALAAISIILGGAVGFLITRSITRPVTDAVRFAQGVAGGNLTTVLDPGNAAGEVRDLAVALNTMASGLSGMICKVKESAGTLTTVSVNIFDASKRVVAAAEVQAGGVEGTSSAIVEINASIKGVAEGVDKLAQSAADSSASILEMAASVEEVAMNVENIANSAEGVSASITQMTASIRQIDGSVVSLKDAATATAVSVAEMGSSIKEVEISAQNAAAISSAVLTDAEAGKSTVEATMAGINEIRRASAITSEVVATLNDRASEIGAILNVIDEVAGQTNLLALNAAIIAAQAGEHGKGFAVVADEIKELADRTSTSTREIADLINGVQDETRRAVQAITHAEKSIADGEKLSLESGEALAKIVRGTQSASEQVAGIARATVEQAMGSVMIRDAMERVSEMVEQIALATGEQRKGSELISTEVERMRGLTSQAKSSTREQSNVANLIAKSTTEITEMIRQIKRACDEQSRGSEQIVHAVEEIRESTSVSLAATRVMDGAVSSLSGQVRVLENEMEGFRIG